MKKLHTLLIGFVLSTVGILPQAHARFYDLYRADYVKGTFCSVVGGACASDNDFDSAFFQNPASLTASGANWDYDYDHFSGKNLEPGMKQNNSVSETTFMAAAAYSSDNWGVGLSYTVKTDQVNASASFYDTAANAIDNFDAYTVAHTYQFNLPFSLRVNKDYHVGATLMALFQQSATSVSGSNSSTSDPAQNWPAFGLSIGSIYNYSKEWRFGGWLRSPITYYMKQQVTTQSALSQFVYNEDIALNYPWMCAGGVSWMPWEDKRTFMFDANLVGVTKDGYLLGYDNFALAATDSKLVAKGRNMVIDPRFGMRLPWSSSSNGTLSLGTYYESSRWEGYDGLWHFTGGLAYKIPQFKFLMFDGIELMLGADVARNYSLLFFTYR